MVVPVRDGGTGLQRLIEALRAQTVGHESFEVIIADDGSTDEVPGRLPREDWLRLAPGPALGPYFARNRGARLARSPVIAFTDADCIPAPNWLEVGLAMMDGRELVAGRVDPLLPSPAGIWSLLDAFCWHDWERLAIRYGSGAGPNLFVRRELFLRLGGFDESLVLGADVDLVHRAIAAGASGGFVPELLVRHPMLADGRAFLRRHWRRHAWIARRNVREGVRPDRLHLRQAIPLMAAVRRTALGLPFGCDKTRFREAGIELNRYDRARVAVAYYGFLEYWSAVAQLWGWWSERRLRRRA